MHVYVGTHWVQRRALAPLEWESQAVMSHPMWVPLLEQYVLLWLQGISPASEDLETYSYSFIYISLAFIYSLLR